MRYLILLLPVLAFSQGYPIVSSFPASNGDGDIFILMSDSSYYRDTSGGWTKLTEKPINTWIKTSIEPSWTTIIRTADTTHNNRGTGSPLFQFNMDANAMYEIEGKIYDTTAATTTSFVTFISVSGTVKSGTVNVQNDLNTTMGTDQLYTDQMLFTSSSVADSSLPATNGVTGPQTMRIWGIIITNANARAFTFGFKSEVTGSAVVVLKNSKLSFRKLQY